MVWNIPLSEPELGTEEVEAVTAVLKNKWLTMGAVTAEFEEAFAKKMDVKHAIAVTNCTAALHLANVALGLSAGDEVICPALTFVATSNAIRYTGASVRFAGVVSPEDLTISPRDIERKISASTKAIAIMHYAGFPCRMNEILDIARTHGLKLIEDCAHAPFAWHQFPDGRRTFVGALGDVGCFSFFGNKNMTTGEGGMITTNNDELAARIRLLRSHGMTMMTYDRHHGHANDYDVVMIGYNYRMDEMRSAIGKCQLARVDALNQARRRIYKSYIEQLSDAPGITVPFRGRDLEASACHIMPVLVEAPGIAREHLRRLGIQTSKHYRPIPAFSAYGSLDREFHELNGLITLPLSPQMQGDDVERVTTALKEIMAKTAGNRIKDTAHCLEGDVTIRP